MKDIDLIESELSRCNKCGYCMQSCPVYRVVRREGEVARGRNQTVRAVAEGAAVTKEMASPFFGCLLCGACTIDCFGRVQTKELMVRARDAYHAEFGQPAIQRYIFHKLLPDPDRLAQLVRLASLGKRTGLSGVARRLGLLRWISPALDSADSLVDEMPRTFLRDRLSSLGFRRVEVGGVSVLRLDPEHATGPKVLYFIGCGTNFQVPATAEAAIKVLHAAGCQLTIAPNNCCGLPPWSYGDIEAASFLAQRNVDLLSALDFDVMVSECGSCSGFLKEYAAMLPREPKAGQLAERTRDITELLVTCKLPKPTHSSETVTYHDPCHLGRQQEITVAPRKLLVDGAGLKLVEMAESNWCCGGAGSYNLSHPEMSREILARKMSRIDGTQADVICTACPACIIQISSGSRNSANPRPVRHVVELVADRLP
jgi:glycolate oxidase iron-sulfur subunit